MIWFLAVVIVLLIGGVAVVAAGHGAPLAPAYDDRPDVRIPADRPLTSADLRGLRFTTTLRGYRASEVDALLDRLAIELADQPEIQPGAQLESQPETQLESPPDSRPDPPGSLRRDLPGPDVAD